MAVLRGFALGADEGEAFAKMGVVDIVSGLRAYRVIKRNVLARFQWTSYGRFV